ncbi:hypothetical protein pb186bvf_011419 [Paramecium bursaria]
MLGFGIEGIVAGSIAAGIQSLIGNVSAGSVFAVCTSIGMGGAFPPLLIASLTILGLAAVGVGVWYLFFRSE